MFGWARALQSAAMDLFQIVAILVALTALFSYLNQRYIGLPASVGVMLIAMLCSILLIAMGKFGLGVRLDAQRLVGHIEFSNVLLSWMLGFLLFAGATSIDLGELARQRGITAGLSVLGTLASTFLIGGLTFVVVHLLRIKLAWLSCLLLGALISPTDPVAVLALVRRAGAPRSIETIIAGESLFNDGVGVVIFFTVLKLSHVAGSVTSVDVIRLFIQEAFGGAVLGFLAGLLVYKMLQGVRGFQVEVLLTLGLAMGAYALADALEVSGPIAVVVAGLFIGNRGQLLSMPAETVSDLNKFWELVEQILNGVLFVLIGLEILVMPYTPRFILAAVLMIPLVLVARWGSVAGMLRLIAPRRKDRPAMTKILTWGGLRGGLAIAMALSIPDPDIRRPIVAITYGVVAFSILVQGTTVRFVIESALR
ncbi:MAG: sodium:proton antiporter [Tepidisphaeraceae bacterium]|jgi:CPA1 family monovalent cation:H+ antiporter